MHLLFVFLCLREKIDEKNTTGVTKRTNHEQRELIGKIIVVPFALMTRWPNSEVSSTRSCEWADVRFWAEFLLFC